MQRIPILDGWRALSILLVLAGHLLPLGPHRWGLNGAVAASASPEERPHPTPSPKGRGTLARSA